MRTLKYKNKPEGLDYIIILNNKNTKNSFFYENKTELTSFLKSSNIQYKLKSKTLTNGRKVVTHLLIDTLASCLLIRLMFNEKINEIMKLEKGVY